MPKIKSIFNPKLKLVRGTRLTSGLFIGASLAAAAGILWAANMYYNIDTETIMVSETHQVTGTFYATTTLITSATSTAAALTVQQTGSGYGMVVTGGKVGIATSTPRYDLDVWGDIGFGTSTAAGTGQVPVLYVDSGSGGRVGIGTTTLFGLLTVGTTTPALVVDPRGYVGIATTSPSFLFSVQGNLYATNLYGSGANLTNLPASTNLVDIGDVDATADDAYGNMILWDGDSWAGRATSSLGLLTTNVAEGTNLYFTTARVDSHLSGGTGITYNTGAISFDCSEVEGEGIDCVGELITLNATTTVDYWITQKDLVDVGDVDATADDTYGNLVMWDGDSWTGKATSSLNIHLRDIDGWFATTTWSGDLVISGNTTTTGSFWSGDSSNYFYIDGIGNATTTGDFYAATIHTAAGDATVRKSGDQIMRGVAPIFGFDLPARCNTSCNSGSATATISRVVENDDDIFPAAYPGTTRKYQFSIRYADATTTATTKTTWDIATSSDPTYTDRFYLPPTDSTDLAKGYATTTGNVSLPASDDWFLRVSTGHSGGYDLQVYDILLIGLDQVD